MSSTTMEKPQVKEMTVAGLLELMETDRPTFMRVAGLIRPPKKTLVREDQIDFLENLYTVTALPVVETEISIDVVSPVKAPAIKKKSNESLCEACGDVVTLLPRGGKKLAYYEDTVVVGNAKRILYWCEPCANY